jgi:hypothetical protein
MTSSTVNQLVIQFALKKTRALYCLRRSIRNCSRVWAFPNVSSTWPLCCFCCKESDSKSRAHSIWNSNCNSKYNSNCNSQLRLQFYCLLYTYIFYVSYRGLNLTSFPLQFVFAITILVIIPHKLPVIAQPTAISTQQLHSHLCAAQYT